jgi:glycosyltransferase involved in cell wall biosynthesis
LKTEWTLIDHGHIAEFSILGGMPDEPLKKARLLKQIQAMGESVRYLGVVTDVWLAIVESYCVVLPSYRDGAPRSILEAPAMGMPVVVTDLTGCNAVVNNNITRFLCSPMDAADLAQKMVEVKGLSHQERIRMGEAGAQLMRDSFDAQIVLDAQEHAVAQSDTLGTDGQRH